MRSSRGTAAGKGAVAVRTPLDVGGLSPHPLRCRSPVRQSGVLATSRLSPGLSSGLPLHRW